SGLLVLSLEDVNQNPLVKELVDQYESTIRLHLPPEDVVLRCDRSRVSQVLTNLLTNAIKYGLGKPIEVSLSEDQDNVFLSVKDEGMGITEEAQSHIFDRFSRAIESRSIG